MREVTEDEEKDMRRKEGIWNHNQGNYVLLGELRSIEEEIEGRGVRTRKVLSTLNFSVLDGNLLCIPILHSITIFRSGILGCSS